MSDQETNELERPSKQAAAPSRRWTDADTAKFLSIMNGSADTLGYYERIKKKKLERKRAMEEVAALLRSKNVNVTGSQVDNK